MGVERVEVRSDLGSIQHKIRYALKIAKLYKICGDFVEFMYYLR